MTDYVDRRLCEQLASAFNWQPEAWWAKSAYSGEWMVIPSRNYKAHELADEPGAGDFYDHEPAYSLGFVLDHVPKRETDITSSFLLGRSTDNKRWSAVYADIVVIEPLPQNAIAKLLLRIKFGEHWAAGIGPVGDIALSILDSLDKR